MNFKYIKTIIFGIFILVAVSAKAQSVAIYGFVKSINNNIGIGNHQVLIQSQIDTANGTGMNYYSTIFTSSNGFFVDSVTIPQGQNVMFKISTYDCQNNIVFQNYYTLSPTSINLFICDTGLLSCKSDYLSYPDTGNHKKVYFLNMSTPYNGNFTWYFGDGDSSISKSPSHIYAQNGIYQVTLKVVDTVSSCFDIKTDSILVSPGFYCQNSFLYTTNFLDVNFWGTVNNSLPTIYNWNFGDGFTASGQNPNHKYNQPGIYKVTLNSISINLQNFDTCISESSKYISIQAPPKGNIWGQIFADSLKVSGAEALLYRFVNPKIGYILIDSTKAVNIDSLNLCFYYFEKLPYDTYLTKIRIDNQSNLTKKFAAAYLGNTFSWQIADSFHLHKAGENKPIHLTEISKPNGNIRIQGRVLQGSQKNPGDPIAEVALYLYNVQGEVKGFTKSDINGNYHFNNLGFEKYFIHADIINKKIYPAWVWPDNDFPIIDHINIYVGSDEVTGMKEIKEEAFAIYPNPTTDFVHIEIVSNNRENASLQIFNSSGQLVLSSDYQLEVGANHISANLSAMSKGVYTIRLTGKNFYSKTHKIILL